MRVHPIGMVRKVNVQASKASASTRAAAGTVTPRRRPHERWNSAPKAFLPLAVTFLAACASAGGSPDAGEPRAACAWRVCITTAYSSQQILYVARNDGLVPATVGISFQRLQNLRTSDPDTVYRIVPVGMDVTIARLEVVEAGEAIGLRPVVTVDLGNDSADHDPGLAYAIPFGGAEPRELISGYGGPTHLAENHYSFDFGMPEGTPVLAARDGIVAYLQDGFREGGLRSDLIERANLVVVGHEDGTLASYGHLLEGIPVSVGDSVRTGQLLGWSGSTGFSGRPHLHFHVGKRLMGGPNRTIPVQFSLGGGEVADLREGEWYEPNSSWRVQNAPETGP